MEDGNSQKHTELIKSISYDQSEIIKNILTLYVPGRRIDCDPTYSIGNFYKNTGIAEPTFKFDVCPQSPIVDYGDAQDLPLPDGSIECLMFDPPFLATRGASLSKKNGNNKINQRFGVYPNEKALHNFYLNSIREAYRVLAKDGIYIVKCQDKVSSGKQYLSHVFIVNEAISVGFYPIDLFVLLAKNRLVANWQRNQKHARKFHSYFIVFKKTSKNIEYI